MTALSLGLVLADLYHGRINYITEHIIPGGIVSILFFTMCNYGFEIFNWILLASVPLYIFMRWLFSKPEKPQYDEDNECDMCKKPKKTCGCQDELPKIQHKKYKKPHTCPAEGGLTMGDECGISRFT